MQSGVCTHPATSRIAYGTDFVEALARELDLAPARRVYAIASSAARDAGVRADLPDRIAE